MDTEPVVKRGRGRPRKNPLPTVVAKSTIVRISSVDGSRTEYNNVVHSSLNYAGNKYPGPGSGDSDAFRLMDLESSSARTPVIVNQEEAAKAEAAAQMPEKRKRGRPRKNPLPETVSDTVAAAPIGTAGGQAIDADGLPVKKKRGRPPKNAVQAVSASETSAEKPAETVAEVPEVRRRPGRPRKIELPEIIVYPDVKDAEVRLDNVSVSDGENPYDFKGPGVRRGKEIRVGEAKLSFFYIVFKNPANDGLLFPDTMHSIQHMLSAAAKETHLNNIVKVLPCGSRTAFEVAVLDPQSDFARNALRKLMITAAYMEKLPDSELQRCSNPRYHNFEDARREICDFVNTMYGVVINSQTGDYSW